MLYLNSSSPGKIQLRNLVIIHVIALLVYFLVTDLKERKRRTKQLLLPINPRQNRINKTRILTIISSRQIVKPTIFPHTHTPQTMNLWNPFTLNPSALSDGRCRVDRREEEYMMTFWTTIIICITKEERRIHHFLT